MLSLVLHTNGINTFTPCAKLQHVTWHRPPSVLFFMLNVLIVNWKLWQTSLLPLHQLQGGYFSACDVLFAASYFISIYSDIWVGFVIELLGCMPVTTQGLVLIDSATSTCPMLSLTLIIGGPSVHTHKLVWLYKITMTTAVIHYYDAHHSGSLHTWLILHKIIDLHG